ncbi:DUF5919 domain-containing protein, partial [Kitasatospora arboriphila]|uniref:DUF5919 domain-containing protein n=1 Tax=Kitasatospora arboriphila TaxID=258052 RepID=UPI0031CF4E1E
GASPRRLPLPDGERPDRLAPRRGGGSGRVRARRRDPGGSETRVSDEIPRFTPYRAEAPRAPGQTGGRRRSGDVGIVQPYLRRARGIESPAIVLRGGAGQEPGGTEPGLLEVYREEFEGSWADSRAVS